jgi:hypothetical protein
LAGSGLATGLQSVVETLVKEVPMRRYLVVAHQTLGSPELLDAMRARLDEGPCTFHLVVPELHTGSGGTWTEGEVKRAAAAHLEEARMRFTAEGLAVTGEVGDANPAEAVAQAMRTQGSDAFAAVIVSTLPLGVSKWLKLDAPSRIQRSSGLPVVHVVGHPVHA